MLIIKQEKIYISKIKLQSNVRKSKNSYFLKKKYNNKLYKIAKLNIIMTHCIITNNMYNYVFLKQYLYNGS